MEISFFYIPVGDEAEAAALGNLALKKKLAACTNIFPVQSAFMWEGALQQEPEFILVLKTMPHKKKALRELLESNHSYETPCILSWDAEVNAAYGAWVDRQVKGDIGT